MVAVRDAEWMVVLCLLAAAAVGASALVDGRSLPGLLATGFALPFAALRGLPWLGRSLALLGSRATGPARLAVRLRTAALSAVLVLVFGALFASADAVFASWAGTLVPDVTRDDAGPARRRARGSSAA